MHKLLLSIFFIIIPLTLFPTISKAQNQNISVSIIYDADMGPMIDDVGALAVLHALADKGEARILATVASNKHETIAQVFDVINTYYGKPNIPIGVPKDLAVNINDVPEFPILGGWTDVLVKKYPADIRSNEIVPSAVEVYRKVLSEQPDKSVTIVSVGFLTNLADLLASIPDNYSELNGEELIKKKVDKVISMAGKFPNGREYNLYMDMRASKFAFENWPTEIIYSGFEIGKRVQTGYPLIKNNNIKDSPIRDVYRMKIDKNRSSFDQTAVLVAIRGVEPYYKLKEGRIIVNWDGSNSWDKDKKGQYYLVENQPPENVEKIINELLQHPSSRY